MSSFASLSWYARRNSQRAPIRAACLFNTTHIDQLGFPWEKYSCLIATLNGFEAASKIRCFYKRYCRSVGSALRRWCETFRAKFLHPARIKIVVLTLCKCLAECDDSRRAVASIWREYIVGGRRTTRRQRQCSCCKKFGNRTSDRQTISPHCSCKPRPAVLTRRPCRQPTVVAVHNASQSATRTTHDAPSVTICDRGRKGDGAAQMPA